MLSAGHLRQSRRRGRIVRCICITELGMQSSLSVRRTDAPRRRTERATAAPDDEKRCAETRNASISPETRWTCTAVAVTKDHSRCLELLEILGVWILIAEKCMALVSVSPRTN